MTTDRQFDPDALLRALPRRRINPIGEGIRIPASRPRPTPPSSSLGESGEYNGFTDRERNRTASLSIFLASVGATLRPAICDICRKAADDEHAENYYDLSGWIGLCKACHRSALHGRFVRPAKWHALLDSHSIPDTHWARLVSMQPFDMARLMRQRGQPEPVAADFGPAKMRVINMEEFGAELQRRRQAYKEKHGHYPDLPRNSGKDRTASKKALLKAIEDIGGKW